MSKGFPRNGNGPGRRDRLADDAVYREPVSAPNSLITGKKCQPPAAPEVSNSADGTGVFDPIPSVCEQEISKARTGKKIFRAGNLDTCPVIALSAFGTPPLLVASSDDPFSFRDCSD